jgi:hypothetical protein
MKPDTSLLQGREPDLSRMLIIAASRQARSANPGEDSGEDSKVALTVLWRMTNCIHAMVNVYDWPYRRASFGPRMGCSVAPTALTDELEIRDQERETHHDGSEIRHGRA